jgi:tripartite-type tricarboxylate transporter receptor subunit TctC
MKFRPSLHLLMLAAFAGTCGSGLAQDAQSYPDKPIRIIVPFAPGGSSDVLARSVGQKLTEMWGQQVLVDNRPGAGGNIGASETARSELDPRVWTAG